MNKMIRLYCVRIEGGILYEPNFSMMVSVDGTILGCLLKPTCESNERIPLVLEFCRHLCAKIKPMIHEYDFKMIILPFTVTTVRHSCETYLCPKFVICFEKLNILISCTGFSVLLMTICRSPCSIERLLMKFPGERSSTLSYNVYHSAIYCCIAARLEIVVPARIPTSAPGIRQICFRF